MYQFLPFTTSLWRTLVLLFVLQIASLNTFAQRNKKSVMKDLPSFFVDDSPLPNYLKAIYKQDAARLCIRLLNQELRPSKQTVEIPEELLQAVYNALVAVRLSDYSAIDTLTERYYVRTFPVPSVQQFILITNHDEPWLEPLRRRQSTTGNEALNEILEEYHLSIKRLVYVDEERIALVLQSAYPINIPALSLRMFTKTGLGSIEEILPYGDGNDISIERTKEGWSVNYQVKFGNCQRQCQKAHFWQFEVDESGSVAYQGSNGQTIPPWITKNRQAERYPDRLLQR